jgi:signal transduction histidine kinase
MPRAAHNASDPDPRAAEAGSAARRDAAFEQQKSSFLRMVSHELRTPLNSILGFSDILASELYGPLGDPHYKEYAEIIRGSGAKLLRMVNQVLELARLDGGSAEMNLAPEPMEAALDDAAATLRGEMAERDIHLRVEDAADRLVIADPKGLRSVLGNLLSNAVAFSPDGGEVRVACERCDAWLEIRIADDGEGVDASDLPRLVKPFEQRTNALIRRGEGAGLGLAIVDLTCQAMGGRLKLASERGKGMTAVVRLRAG